MGETFDPTLRALHFYREQLIKAQGCWATWSENYELMQIEIEAIDRRLSPFTLRIAS